MLTSKRTRAYFKRHQINRLYKKATAMVLDELPKRVSLNYVDRNDSLEFAIEDLHKAFKSGDASDFVMKINEAFDDQTWESVSQCKKDIISTLEDDEDFSSILDKLNQLSGECNDTEEFVEASEELNDAIYARDDSDVIKDLIRNSGKIVMFYDVDYEVGCHNCLESAAWYRLERYKIKKHLGITHANHDSEIDTMIMQAGCGGSLVIYFNDYTEELLNVMWGRTVANTIAFSDYALAIINVGNGSGDSIDCIVSTYETTFDIRKVSVEGVYKYNYTYAVCGMSSDWCSSTYIEFLNKQDVPVTDTTEVSAIDAIHEQDQKYAEAFKKGTCTLGDMDITRHRNVTYINDFPCGNHCLSCGTFWID